jgi:hypothetical protein
MKRPAKKRGTALRPIPETNCIQMYFHCRRCLAEMPPGTSPREFARLECGWTEIGFQVWCKRHQINIVHVDFEGQQHPATQGGYHG